MRQRQSSGAEERVVDALLERSWCPVINNILTEDLEGYGSIIKGIKPYMGRNGHGTMMLWTVVGMVSACNLLHIVVPAAYAYQILFDWILTLPHLVVVVLALVLRR